MSKDKNFGLDEQAFNAMLVQVRSGELQLFEHFFLSHFDICMRYIINKYGSSRDDAYDCTMETLLDFRQKLVDKKIRYGNLKYLFTRMASNKYVDIHLRKPKHIDLDDRMDQAIDDNLVTFDEEAEEALIEAWEKLGLACKKLLKLNFYQGLKLVEIADQLESNAAAIRKQKQRCIEKLKEHYLVTIKE